MEILRSKAPEPNQSTREQVKLEKIPWNLHLRQEEEQKPAEIAEVQDPPPNSQDSTGSEALLMLQAFIVQCNVNVRGNVHLLAGDATRAEICNIFNQM